MALTSETLPSPNGVDCIEHESIDVLNEEDLEDGEIFEDEEPSSETKSAPPVQQPKTKPVQETNAIAPTAQDKPNEPLRNHRGFEKNDKPQRDQRVPFFKGKRKLMENEDEDRWKRDGKRNRRSQEFEREGDPGRMKHEGEPGEDDEEMMFVRGASPHPQDGEKDKWDRDGDEDIRHEMPRRPVRSFRGRGVSRRGERQRGRGRGRGGLRTNKRKRDDAEMCVFFLQGKCHRGSECPFAHEILPPRKLELCKFYMKDCCAKKDKCLYMHSEFPCKYYHTGLKCYANKKCKFSHAPLSDATRNVLAKHLDTAPKDILGDFSRRDRDQRDRGDSRDMRGGDHRDMRCDSRDMRGDSRDMRGDSRDMRGDSRDMRGDSRDMRGDSRDMRGDSRDMRDRGEFPRNKHDRDRKIPSLFDIKVTIPDEMRNSDENHTPMPSPTQRSQDSTRSSDRDNYTPDLEREREKDREREHERLRLEKAERSKERKAKREKAREHRKERRERKEKEKEKKRERSRDVISEKKEIEESDDHQNPDIMSPTQSEENIRSSFEAPHPVSMDKSSEEHDKKVTNNEINGLFPQHLPKKQQELFLRIQQQQREAESSQASANDDDEDDKAEEDNWYSSDEEMAPAPSLMTTATTANPVTPLLNILASASAAAKPLEVSTTLPTPFIPSNLDLSNLSTVFEALTNLQKMNFSATKTVEQQQSTTTLTSSAAPTTITNTELPTEPPKSEPTILKPEPPRMRDPRLRSDGGSIEIHRRSIEGPIDMDLRPQPAKVQTVPSSGDVDLRSLPFKPVQHSAANEIDASISSHSPIVWQLLPTNVIKADYSSLQIQPKPGVVDPRLRRVVRPPTDELGLPRDPRQRLLDEPARDPRARQPLLATPQVLLATPQPLLPTPVMPATPRYDEDHRPQLYHMDSDMRQFPPPTPRLEDEVYTPGPSRPVDPRQRSKIIEDPRRTSIFPPRPDDIDLRPQMVHRVPFVNFNK